MKPPQGRGYLAESLIIKFRQNKKSPKKGGGCSQKKSLIINFGEMKSLIRKGGGCPPKKSLIIKFPQNTKSQGSGT